MSIRQFWGQIVSGDFFAKLAKDDLFKMSAALAFYTALTLAPLLILLLTFISLIHQDFREQLLSQIQGLVGSEASVLIRQVAAKAELQGDIRNVASIVGTATLLFSAGAIFGDLRSSLNIIFGIDPAKEESQSGILQSSWALLKRQFFKMGMVVTFVFISIVSLIVSSVLSLILHPGDAAMGQILNFLISLFIFWILFSAIFYFLPERSIRKRVAMISGLVAAVLFSFGKSLIGLYLGQSAVASLYGAAGSLLVLLMWVYYSSMVIYFSAEIGFELNREDMGGDTQASSRSR